MNSEREAGSRQRRLTKEEMTLWVEVTKSIKPRRGLKPLQAPDDSPAPAAKPLHDRRFDPPASSTPSQPKKSPPLAPVEKRLRQKLSRGRLDVPGKLDLHGMRQSQAHAALLRFLRQAQDDGLKLVLVVTGKGSGKAGESGSEPGILRRMVPHWLAAPEMRTVIIGFEEAAALHGGAGALYVRLRRKRDRS